MMYLNVISFKNGKTLAFRTDTPYSVNKLNEDNTADRFGDWNLVTDSGTGEIMSFRGSEIVTISTAMIKNDPIKSNNRNFKSKKKKNFKAKVIR